MNIEIERKFLVINTNFKKISFQKKYIKQGFLNSNKDRVVRIRIVDQQGFLTIKGKSSHKGTTRFEWEQKISFKDANELLNLCEEGIIEKNRYYHQIENHIVEIDEFLGDNIGLLVAEIELKEQHEDFKKPHYLGKEVTGDEKYYNSNLSKHAFKYWHKKTSN